MTPIRRRLRGTGANTPVNRLIGTVAGFAGGVLVYTIVWQASASIWWLLAGAGAFASVQSNGLLLRFRGHRSEAISHDEVLFPVLLVVLGPGGAVVAVALGVLASNVIARRAVRISTFNVACFTTAASVGAGTYAMIARDPGGPVVAAAALAGSLAYAVTSISLFSSLLSRLGGVRLWSQMVALAKEDAHRLLTEVTLGSMSAVAVAVEPALSPLAALAILVVLASHHRWFAISRDRERLADLLTAAGALHRTVSVDEVDRVLLEAVRDMVGGSPRISSLAVEGVSVPIDSPDGMVRNLVVERQLPLDPTEIVIVESLARIANISMRTASLLAQHAEQSQHLADVVEKREAFLLAAAHQLRTPLTAILGFGEVLAEGGGSETERTEMAAEVVDQAAAMSHLIDNLLVASRSTLDHDLAMGPFEPTDLVAEVRRVFGELGLDDLAAEGRATAFADPLRVRQILRNLVGNAVQHGGGEIAIRVTEGAAEVGVEVVDSGPGIPVEDLDNAFSPFVQLRPTPGRPGHIGIGLPVARQLAQLMGGSLVYRRHAGTTIFAVTLPRADRSWHRVPSVVPSASFVPDRERETA